MTDKKTDTTEPQPPQPDGVGVCGPEDDKRPDGAPADDDAR